MTRRELFDELQVPIAAREVIVQRATQRVIAEGIKIAFILRGHAILRWPAASHRVTAGDVVVLAEGVWCAAEPLLPTSAITMYINSDFLRADISWIPPGHPLKSFLQSALTQQLPVAGMRFVLDVMHALTPVLRRMAHATNHPTDPYLLLEASASLFARIARQASVAPETIPSARYRPGEIVARAVEQVTHDLDRRWSVADLASAVAISESQLTRLFQAELATSPAAFVREQRVGEMARLLSTGGAGVAEAAQQAGWRDASSASRAFRQSYGVTPRAYNDRAIVAPSGSLDRTLC